MYHCQFCGNLLDLVESGGCGGRGSIYGCPNCHRRFEQTSGGMFSTPNGETLSPISGFYSGRQPTLKELL